jgi:16S rRNA (adenine(1408)-N(1))-methyltransferase
VEVRSDNSRPKNSESLSSHTGEGVVIDIGTGDGRFVSAAARANPNKLFIGVDANVKPLEKPSMKATRKPSRGGLPNVLFVQAAIEDLPDELSGSANEIHIHFPWGSLLKAVVCGEENALTSLRRISADDCLLEIIVGIDPIRDKTEVERLGIPVLSGRYIEDSLKQEYEKAGFKMLERGTLSRDKWSRIETSWAKRLSVSEKREVIYMLFEAA